MFRLLAKFEDFGGNHVAPFSYAGPGGVITAIYGWIKRNIKKKLQSGLNEWRDPQGDEDSMKPCDEVTIEGIDQALYDKLMARAVSAGATFSGSLVTLKGCKFNWTYDAPSATLHYICLHREFFISCSEIDSHIRDLVQKSKEAL